MPRLIFAVCLSITLFFAAAPSLAGELAVSGSLSNETRLRLLQNDMPDDMDWDITAMMTKADFIARATDEERIGRLFMNFDLRHDPTGVFDETDDIEWRLREAYGGFYSEYVSFELGKKIYAWGMADEFNPTDLLNPEDLRWVFSHNKGERKLGVYSANLTLQYDNFALQGVIVPVFEPHILPASDSDWLPWELGLFYNLIDAFPEFVEFQPRHVPNLNARNTDRAARFTGTVGPVDFAMTYFDGFDDLPLYNMKIDIDANGMLGGAKPLTIREAYQRYQAYGGSLAVTAGSFGFRSEGAYYTPRTYNATIDSSLLMIDNLIDGFLAMQQLRNFDWHVESPSFSAVGGVDWREGTRVYLNFQYVHNQILEYDEENLYEEFEGLVTGKARTLWLEDDLAVAVNSAYNVYQGDWFAKPYVAYNWTVDFETELGVQLYGGDEETRFGAYNFNDYAYLKMKYNF